MIREAEKSRARINEIPGKVDLNMSCLNVNVASINEDYQMIDTHVDDNMRKKIINFEFVDFSKLVIKYKPIHEDENRQRLEIVSKDGMSFLSPVPDREGHMTINSYSHWEQTFSVFSNILMTHYPQKSTELLQYNHTIHMAAVSYVWENVYAYDREFRHHISRHPRRPWNVILQQVWTMLLKDRLRNKNSFFQCGGRQNKRDKEPCRRFNKGRCTFGLSCKYDHRCSVKKCGKFGHGAHICHLRHTENDQGNAAAEQVVQNEHKKS